MWNVYQWNRLLFLCAKGSRALRHRHRSERGFSFHFTHFHQSTISSGSQSVAVISIWRVFLLSAWVFAWNRFDESRINCVLKTWTICEHSHTHGRQQTGSDCVFAYRLMFEWATGRQFKCHRQRIAKFALWMEMSNFCGFSLYLIRLECRFNESLRAETEPWGSEPN